MSILKRNIKVRHFFSRRDVRCIVGILSIAILTAGAIIIFSQHDSQEVQSANAVLAQLDERLNFRLASAEEDRDDYVRSQMNLCHSVNGAHRCYEQVAKLLFAQYSLPDLMRTFSENENHPEIFSQCHAASHYLGRESYKETKSVPESYGQCTFSCWGGCYHGVMEQYFAEKDIPLFNIDPSVLAAEVKSICGSRTDYDQPRIYSECLHGIGHAMMFITGADLPQSLAFCDFLGSVQKREVCYGGVFMENSSSSTNLSHPSQYISETDPMYPCTILEEKYLPVCYKYQSSHFLLLAGNDWREVVRLCGQVPQEYRNGCFQIMGSNQVGSTNQYTDMARACDLITQKEYRKSCIGGVVNGLSGRYVGDVSHMTEFCGVVETELKPFCFSVLGRSIKEWSPDPGFRSRVCEEFSEQEAAWCQG